MACPSPSPQRTVLCSPDLEARRKRFAGGIALLCLIAVAGCGGAERQDADEPEGNFAVEVVTATFPKKQKLAQSSTLVITVRNSGNEAVPNVAVTLKGLSFHATEADLANPERPQFVVNGVQREIAGFPEAKNAAPLGCDTAYVDTWACGRLKPGAEKTFVWKVTAVKAGPYDIAWRVAAGLNGKAKAVTAGGGAAPSGKFTGTVSDKAPDVRIADDGKTVVSGTR
ncbi:MAG: hypothetical protein QOD71_2365 [Thermoleophilaceae bacterium]|nr:hypothetical protein [Thermoleophilaceae bacterium]